MPPDDSQEDHVEGLPLGTRGGLLFRHNFPQDAEYEFSVKPAPQHRRLHDRPGVRRTSSRSAIDGERVFVAQVGGEEDNLRVGHEHVGDRRQDRRAAEDAA